MDIIYNNNFSNFSSSIKPIALYYPEFSNFNINFTYLRNNNDHNYNIDINQDDLIDINKDKIQKIKNQINLAKSHGIYGFAIYFLFYFNNTYIKDISIFLNNEELEIPFLLIWGNNNFFNLYNIVQKENNDEEKILSILFNKFVNQIKVFMINRLYIKINNKPILAIENPLIFDLKKILLLRKIFKNKGIGEIFIICPFESDNILKKTELFDAFYDLPEYELVNNRSDKVPISYYSGIIYKNINLNKFECEPIFFRSSLLETNLIWKEKALKFYSPEKFYLLNKIIIEWTKDNFYKTKGFYFLNSWNDYRKGYYLEPDNIYGYAALNSFSKALFNFPFIENNYKYLYLDNVSIIAIQAHIYFEDLTNEVIDKTNNIPFKYDLFITTVSLSKKQYIEQYLEKYSKANRYEISIVENKGRDVLPFIIQMKDHIKEYKYICHIHSKKTQKYPITGNLWRQYLYNNLLGDEEIISQIIYDFETYDKLGFIFPDTYYYIVKGVKNFESIDFKHHKENIYYINFVNKHIFGNIKIGKKLIFPSGDMFWAKIDAIHQIFEINFIKMFPKEMGQLNQTVMHAIERIWLYLVKLNGYYYKTIFKKY